MDHQEGREPVPQTLHLSSGGQIRQTLSVRPLASDSAGHYDDIQAESSYNWTLWGMLEDGTGGLNTPLKTLAQPPKRQ